MFRRRRARAAKGIVFSPDTDFWELTVRGRYGEVLLELTRLLPPGQTFFVEGTHTVPLIASYLEARPATDPTTVRSGTIWPRGRSFHMPMTEENMAGLVELMDHVAAPEVGDHLHAYTGTTPSLIWYDAFSDAPLYVRKDVAEDQIRRLCDELGCQGPG